jgi:hypothetical protein
MCKYKHIGPDDDRTLELLTVIAEWLIDNQNYKWINTKLTYINNSDVNDYVY